MFRRYQNKKRFQKRSEKRLLRTYRKKSEFFSFFITLRWRLLDVVYIFFGVESSQNSRMVIVKIRLLEKTHLLRIFTVIFCFRMHSTALRTGNQLPLQFRIVERIYNAFEKEEPLGLTLLVLSKAFDVVSHGILHEKLKNVLTSLI